MSTQSLSNVQATLAPGALALLGFVRRQPRHGYDIYRQLSQAPELRAVWRVKQSRLYALLARREGAWPLLAPHQPPVRRPARKGIRATEAGGGTLLREPSDAGGTSPPIPAGVYIRNTIMPQKRGRHA